MDSNRFYYAPAAYPCLKKFQVSSFKFKVVTLQAFPLFYYSLSNKLYERLCCNLYSCACFSFDILILRTS